MRLIALVLILIARPVIAGETRDPKIAALFDQSTPTVLMWQVQRDAIGADMEYLAELGVTLIQSFSIMRWPDQDVARYLDGAERAGLGVAVTIKGRQGTGADCIYDQQSLDFVRRYKSHPAIVIWHLFDEPALKKITKACQRALYQSIKRIDPDRPAMVSSNNHTRERYRRYFDEDSFDIFEMHIYVNPQPGQRQQNLMAFFQEVRTRDYPVIVTLRAFNVPNSLRWVPMRPGGLAEQYAFFIERPGITKNFGLYGWRLSSNIGVTQIPALRTEFDEFMRARAAAMR